MSSEDFRLSIGGNEVVKGSLLSRGCAGQGGGVPDLKRAGVMAAFIKTLHLLLKGGCRGSVLAGYKRVVSLLLILLLTTSFHREV